MTVTIRQGDCREVLRTLPADSVNCVVTSPPYWGLRDYGVEGQIGLEHCLGDHLALLVDVFREVRRVLRPDGTVWMNYGDAYAAAPNGRSAAETKTAGNDDRTFRDKPISTVGAIYDPNHQPRSRVGAGDNKGNLGGDHKGRVVGVGTLKPKDRMLLPARVAIALCDDGWWLRDEIVWHKPNPMPSSVKDRTTPAHEMIYMFSKSPRYYYDHDAIKEPCSVGDRGSSFTEGHTGIRQQGRASLLPRESQTEGMRAKRSVWSVCPKGFKEAHFATFPPALIEPCILAGCPVGGTVLDPFFGAGTTGLVADRHRRNCIGIKLNADYVAISQRRIMAELVG